jgi:hypothetical protein
MTNIRVIAAANRRTIGVTALYAGIVCFGLPPIWSWLCGPRFFTYDAHLMEYVYDVLFRGWFICVWGSMLVIGQVALPLLRSGPDWLQERPRARRVMNVLVVAMLAAMLSVVAFWSVPFVIVEIMRQAHSIGEGFRKAFGILWLTSPIDRTPVTLFKHLGWFAVLWAAWSWALFRRDRAMPLDPRRTVRMLLAGSVATLVLALSAHFAVVWGDRLQLMFVEWFTAFYAVIATGVLVLSLYCVWQDNTQPSKRTRERPAQRSSALGELVEDHIKQR